MERILSADGYTSFLSVRETDGRSRQKRVNARRTRHGLIQLGNKWIRRKVVDLVRPGLP